MKLLISKKLVKISKEIEKSFVLTEEDIKNMKENCYSLLKTLKKNIKQSKSKPFKSISKEDKILLLAFIVYVRQNIATGITENPNSEDAACILHSDIYKGSNKDDKEKLDDDLTKQLNKAGFSLESTKE